MGTANVYKIWKLQPANVHKMWKWEPANVHKIQKKELPMSTKYKSGNLPMSTKYRNGNLPMSTKYRNANCHCPQNTEMGAANVHRQLFRLKQAKAVSNAMEELKISGMHILFATGANAVDVAVK
jgi:hypothetical protein